MIEVISWISPGHLKCLDQTILPAEIKYLVCKTKEDVFAAIKRLSIRGAPLIGIAGAYGMCVDLFNSNESDFNKIQKQIEATAAYLKSSRPTAVNLFWAIDRMLAKSAKFQGSNISEYKNILLQEAKAIHEEDKIMCDAIGKSGVSLIKNGMRALTHCNAGCLATGGSGTALAVFYQALKEGIDFSVYADETRPLLQGARLTAFELKEAGIKTTLICDNMAGFLMKQGKIDIVITGADRIARNGDTANKIGTFSVARLAHSFNIPFYIAAPSSTFDLKAHGEKDIPIEERSDEEILFYKDRQIAPLNMPVYNPAFDVTDGFLIKGFITEKGIIYPPYEVNIPEVIG